MNKIHKTAIIGDNVTMGDNNTIGAYCVIGEPAQVKGNTEKGKVVIGNNNIVREFVTIDSSKRLEATVIGNDNFILSHSHVAGDCQLGSNINISSYVGIGGGSVIEDYVFLGLGSKVHQRTIIGESALLGINAIAKNVIYPFHIIINFNEYLKDNAIGIKRRAISNKQVKEIGNRFVEKYEYYDGYSDNPMF